MTIIPFAAAALLWFLLSQTRFARHLARTVMPGISSKVLATTLVVAAILVLAHGNVWAALCLFGASLWQLGRIPRRMPQPQSSVSRVRSVMIEMDYDMATGRLAGRVLAGAYTGRALDALTGTQCADLVAVCRVADPDGIRLLEPYLDRRFPGWRQATEGDADAREGRARFTSRMSEDEAYEVLGLRRGATRDDIVRSHRTVMKKWHPDQGGTAALAARANEAKEVLLRSHA